METVSLLLPTPVYLLNWLLVFIVAPNWIDLVHLYGKILFYHKKVWIEELPEDVRGNWMGFIGLEKKDTERHIYYNKPPMKKIIRTIYPLLIK